MKKFLFFFLCCLTTTFCKGQLMVNGRTSNSELAELDTMKIMYSHVLLANNGNSYLGILDVGGGVQWALMDRISKKLNYFKGPAELFNFMFDNQWEYVDTIANVYSTGALVQILFGINVTKTKFIYVFKRRKN